MDGAAIRAAKVSVYITTIIGSWCISPHVRRAREHARPPTRLAGPGDIRYTVDHAAAFDASVGWPSAAGHW